MKAHITWNRSWRLVIGAIVLVLLLFRQTEAATTASPAVDNAPSIYDCLQAASGSDECHAAFGGKCVWCAEPIYGLCVTPSVASKLANLPFFTCDPTFSSTTPTTNFRKDNSRYDDIFYSSNGVENPSQQQSRHLRQGPAANKVKTRTAEIKPSAEIIDIQ